MFEILFNGSFWPRVFRIYDEKFVQPFTFAFHISFVCVFADLDVRQSNLCVEKSIKMFPFVYKVVMFMTWFKAFIDQLAVEKFDNKFVYSVLLAFHRETSGVFLDFDLN